MNALECLNAPFCARLALSLAHFLWEGAAIALAAWGVAAALRRHSSRARYGVYCLALGGMVCALAGTILLVEPPPSRDAAPPRISQWESGPAVFAERPNRERDLVPGRFAGSRDVLPEENTGVSPQGAGGAIKSRWESLSAPLARWWGAVWPVCAPYVSGAYLAGLLAMMLRLVAALGGSGRLRRLSQPVDDASILQSLARQAQALGLNFTPPIAFCRRTVVPTVVGILRPTILLPFTFATGLSADQIEMLLAHELAHVRRWDPLVNVAQRLIEALLFFHPAMWFISRRIRIERELCCDDLVVALGGKPLEYASSLVETASRVRHSARPAFLPAEGLNAAASAAQLKSRVKRLLGAPEHEALRISRAWVVLCCIAAVALLAGVLSSGRTPAGKPENGLLPPERAALRLQFRWEADDPEKTGAERFELAQRNGKTEEVYLEKQILLNESDVLSATAEREPSVIAKSRNDGTRRYYVFLQFNPEATKGFAKVTGANVNRRLAVVFDGKAICAPVIKSMIPNGKVVIQGEMSKEEAENMCGALTAPNAGKAGGSAAATSQTLGAASSGKSAPAGPVMPDTVMTEEQQIQRGIARWDFARAIPAAEDLLKLANDDAARGRCHLLLAQAYGVWGVEYRDAVARDKGRRHLEQAFVLNPALKQELDVARLRAYFLAYRQGSKGKVNQALADTQKEIAAAPRNAQAHYSLGMLHHVLATNSDFAYTKPEQDEERRLALESMAKAVELDPKRYEYWSYYVSALAYAGQKEEAKKAADRMMKTADLSQEKIPPSATCAYEIMSALMEPEEGYAYIRDQAARDPSYAPLQFVAAERYDEKDPVRYKMLTALTARIASGDLRLPTWQARLELTVLYKLGELHYQAGEIEKALDVYDRIISLSPCYAEVRLNRGVVYMTLARKAGTPEEKARLLEKAKNDFEAQLQYPWHDRVADARQYLDKTVKDLEALRAASPPKPTEASSLPVGADSKWGSAVEGVQVRLKTEKSAWKADEHPVFKIDLKSEKERVLPHYGPPLDEFDVRLDGVWYRRNKSGERQESLRSVGPSPGTSRENEHFLLRPDFWCRSDDNLTTMPSLAPGKHTLEVALPLDSADKATSQPLRAVSNAVEIEIAEKSVSLLRQINDVLRKVRGAGTDFDAREKELLALLNDYTDPKDIGVIYAACARIHYGTGSTHFDRLVRYARKSLEYPLDLEARMIACMQWGEGLQLQGGGAAPDLPRQPREEIVKPFLRAIRLTLDEGIPEQPVAVPKLTATRVGGGMIGLDPDVEKRMKEEYNAQIGAMEKAARTNNIIDRRKFHEEKIVSLYSQKPLATEELRQIATEIIGNPAVVNHLIAGVNERIEEQGWGEAVSGVQIRLRDAKPVRGDGVTSPVLLLLKTEATNTGNLLLHLAENGNNCQVEVDGQWYMWFPDSDLQRIGEVKRDGDGAGKGSALLDFGGGKRYTDLSVTIGSQHWRALPAERAEEIAALEWGNTFRAYRSEDIGAPMRLAPGKHRIRVAYNCGSARAGQDIGSVRAVSNPIEIEVGVPADAPEPARTAPPAQDPVSSLTLTTASGATVRALAHVRRIEITVSGTLPRTNGDYHTIPFFPFLGPRSQGPESLTEEEKAKTAAAAKFVAAAGDFVNPLNMRLAVGPEYVRIMALCIFRGEESPNRRIKATMVLGDATGRSIKEESWLLRDARPNRRRSLWSDMGGLDPGNEISISFEKKDRALFDTVAQIKVVYEEETAETLQTPASPVSQSLRAVSNPVEIEVLSAASPAELPKKLQEPPYPTRMRFDGVRDYLEVPDHDRLDIGDAFTVEAWVKIHEARGECSILSKEVPWKTGWTLIAMPVGAVIEGGLVQEKISEVGSATRKQNDPQLYTFTFAVGDGTRFHNLTVPIWEMKYAWPRIAKDEWRHVAATWNKGKAAVYVDGEMTCQQTFEKAAAARVPLRIGKGSADLGRHFNGELSDIRIWSVARTEQQIREDMRKPADRMSLGLAACWPLDDEVLKTGMARDISVHTGTLNAYPFSLPLEPAFRKTQSIEWGEPVDGVRLRLRPNKTVWSIGESPMFQLDIRSDRERVLPHYGPPLDDFDVRLDGVWYRRNKSGEREEGLRSVAPSPATERALHTRIDPRNWAREDSDTTMTAWSDGVYTFQIGFVVSPASGPNGKPLHAVSNPVEIRIMDSSTRRLPAGLEFLAQIPELRALRLEMTEDDLKAILEKENLRATVSESERTKGERNYHVFAGNGENVIVMFREGKCSGIQRMQPLRQTARDPGRGEAVEDLQARLVMEGDFAVGRDLGVNLGGSAGDKRDVLLLHSIRFDEKDVRMKAILKGSMVSWPKGKWVVSVALLDADRKALDEQRAGFENSGAVKGVPAVKDVQHEFDFGPAEKLRQSAKAFRVTLEGPADPGIAWGKADSREIGIGLAYELPPRPFKAGERVGFSLFVRNKSKSVRRLQDYVPMVGYCPTVLDAQGNKIMAGIPAIDRAVQSRTIELQPGETFRLGTLSFLVVSPYGEEARAQENTYRLPPGQYQLFQEYRFAQIDGKATDQETFRSGVLPLTVAKALPAQSP